MLYNGHELMSEVIVKTAAITNNTMPKTPVSLPDMYKPMISAAIINLNTRSA